MKSPLLAASSTSPPSSTGAARIALRFAPAWSPGNYEIQNYARYVHGFRRPRTRAGSAVLGPRRQDTWRVATGRPIASLEFDYSPTRSLSLSARARGLRAFLGTNLSCSRRAVGAPSRGALRLRPVASDDGAKGPPRSLSGGDYHELADADDVRRALQPRFAAGRRKMDSDRGWPAADYTPAVAAHLRTGVADGPVQNRIMGEAPYDVYTVSSIHPRAIDSVAAWSTAPRSTTSCPRGVCRSVGHLATSCIRCCHTSSSISGTERIRPAEMWPYTTTPEQ